MYYFTLKTMGFTKQWRKKPSLCHAVTDWHADKRQKSDKLQSSWETGVQDVMCSDERLTVMSSLPCPPNKSMLQHRSVS